MKVKWSALVLALLLVMLTVTGCGETDPDKIVVVDVNGRQGTKTEAQQLYDWMAKQTIASYTSQGETIDPESTSFISYIKSQALNTMATYMALEQQLETMGHPITEAERAQLKTDAQEEYDMTVETFVASYGMTEEDAKAEIEEMGFPLEGIEYMLYMHLVEDKLYDNGLTDIVVTDDEVQAKYDELVAAAEASYAANPSQYITDAVNGNAIYTIPEGVRYVKNMVLGFTDDDDTAINQKNSELYMAQYTQSLAQQQLDTTEGLTDEQKAELETQIAENTEKAATLTQELNTLREAGYINMEETAQDVLEKVQAEGADFDALLAEYNKDTPPEIAIEKGYPVMEGSNVYVQSFADAAMALEKVGDISGLVKTEYGYHILQYTEDGISGPIPLEDVKGALYEELLTTKKEETFEARLTEWVDSATIKTYINKF